MPMVFSSTPKPHEVFTPRSNVLNQKTYAERPALERRLGRALTGDRYIILYGESGNGKTWLYKKVFEELKVPYEVLNLAKMHTEKSLNAVMLAKLGDLGSKQITSDRIEVDAALKIAGTGGGVKNTTEYKPVDRSAFERLAEEISMVSNQKKSILVFDNFEQIVDNPDFLKEVASAIISADDEFIARNNVKIMIVGTPANITDMISRVSNASTIANRIVEIPEVARLEVGEARHIMSQGFEKHLKLTCLVDRNAMYKAIAYKTDRIAQHVQELCLKIAQIAVETRGQITEHVLAEAERDWLEETLSADVAMVDAQMNAQKTTVGRKNQVIYCLGMVEHENFTAPEVERLVRATFKVEPSINLNIPQTLAAFAKADSPLIRKTGNRGSKYRFCSPKTKMVIRTRLMLKSDSTVGRTI